MNLVELADQHYQAFGEIDKLVFNDRAYSNREIISSANRMAGALTELGIQPGDRVLVQLLNSPDVVICYQAILRAGAVIVPVIYTLQPPEIRHILEDSGARAVITETAFLEGMGRAGQGIGTLEHIIVMDGESDGESDLPADADRSGKGPVRLACRELIRPFDDAGPGQAVGDDDMAVILYTSGTTGVPKGVVLTHRNLYANAVSLFKMDPDRDPDTRSLFFLPLSHSFGLTMMNLGFLIPNPSVVMPRFELAPACRLIQDYGIYKFAGVPAVFAMMLGRPDITAQYDLTSLSECSCGSAPLPLEILAAFEKRFNCTIREGYGLSEASPAVAGHYVGRPIKPGSVGQPLPGVDIRIKDGSGRDLAAGKTGELLVKGENVSAGYYRLPEATEETFKGGWLHTGDMARQDGEGYLFIVDRKKDLIIRGGFNIFPRDVETVLIRHPGVDEAAVAGVPDPVMGEAVKAWVVRAPGSSAEEADIRSFCREHLAGYKCPSRIRFLDAMPRNAMGKILKKELVRRRHAGSAI